MAGKAEINKRRRELCSYKFRGFPLDKIAETLSKKYTATKSTIKQDWYHREEWMPELFDIQPEKEKQIIFDVLTEQKEIKRELWKIYKDGDNDNAKLGALRDIKGTNKELLEMMQSLGYVKREPAKHEITGKDGGPIEYKESARRKVQSRIDSIAARTGEE